MPLPLKVFAATLAAAFVFAAPADAAKKSKHKKARPRPRLYTPTHNTEVPTCSPLARFISAACILVMIPTRISAFSSGAISADVLAASNDCPPLLAKVPQAFDFYRLIG